MTVQEANRDALGRCKMRGCNLCDSYRKQLKADKWISVEERLPDTYDNLLICQSDGYVNVGYYSLNEFKDMNSYPYKDVIAWQPLPQPYKKEGAENGKI